MTTPLSGKIFHRQAGTCYVNQCTKFEISRFTRYEAINGGANAENGVVWVVTGALKVMGNAAIR